MIEPLLDSVASKDSRTPVSNPPDPELDLSASSSSLAQRIKEFFLPGKRRGTPGRADGRPGFREKYQRFKEILSINDMALQTVADVEEKTSGRQAFALDPLIRKVRRAAVDVLVEIRNLNYITGGRYSQLYDVWRRITSQIETEVAKVREIAFEPLVLSLSELRASHAPIAGRKMANLGEVRNVVGLPVPDGFVITSGALARFMANNDLWERATQLEAVLEMYGSRTLAEACREVQMAITNAPIPQDVELAILGAYEELVRGKPIEIAMRSSAVGEDSGASSAGQYHTELHVMAEEVLEAYRSVVASAYRPNAVAYRIERGQTLRESMMAVGGLIMIHPFCSGVAFSRPVTDPGADRVVISTCAGVGADLVGGRTMAEELEVTPGKLDTVESLFLSKEEISWLCDAARKLEAHFGEPQDVEWAVDGSSRFFILQSRPMVLTRPATTQLAHSELKVTPLLEGGHMACPGAGSGPIFLVRDEVDLDRVPQGAVVVARHSNPLLSRIMNRVSAIVTDVGSASGHMAILAREFGVPTLVGLEGATSTLEPDQVVTVDASGARVLPGAIDLELIDTSGPPPLADSPAVQVLRSIARFVTPLRLVDPASPDFHPDGCRSLHDIMRFIHEKVFETMFHFGDTAAVHDRQNSYRLDANVPLEIRVFDVGDGLRYDATNKESVTPEEIESTPLRAFLDGLLDERIRWHNPRPISARGFMSVLSESIVAAPAEARQVGRVSFAIISDRYLNFSTKAGYHFSTVDAYCGLSQNKNYIHFRFMGGAATEDRRARRVQCLSIVLTRLDFHIKTQGDLLVARLEKYERDAIRDRLAALGRLTMCSRQLDMLMDSDASPLFFAEAFLNGELEKFY